MKISVSGLPYMMYTAGGGRGFPKSRQKERCCVNSVRDRGEGVNKSENFADVIYGSPLNYRAATYIGRNTGNGEN